MMEDVVQDAAFCNHQDSEIRNQRNHHMLGSGSCEDTVTSTEPGTWKWMFESWWWLEVLEVCFSFWGSLAQGKGAGSASFRECTQTHHSVNLRWADPFEGKGIILSWVCPGWRGQLVEGCWGWAFDLIKDIKGGILQLGGVWNSGCIWFLLEFSHRSSSVVNLVADPADLEIFFWYVEVVPFLGKTS